MKIEIKAADGIIIINTSSCSPTLTINIGLNNCLGPEQTEKCNQHRYIGPDFKRIGDRAILDRIQIKFNWSFI